MTPVIPYRAALPKSSLDVTSACTSVLRALTGRDDRMRCMHRSCAYAVRQVRLTCAAIDIVESSCTPRSRMLVANNMASVFFSFKSRQRDASHALTSITQRRIRSTAEAESPAVILSIAIKTLAPLPNLSSGADYPLDATVCVYTAAQLYNNNSIYLYSAIYPELKSCSEALITTSACL